MTESRALQIINNCVEEFADHGKTNFATKKDLCETILWLREFEQSRYFKSEAKMLNIKNQALKLITEIIQGNDG